MEIKYIPELDRHLKAPAIELLYVLRDVNEYGGFEEASRQMPYSRMSLMRKVKDLEERAGGKVYVKYKKSFILTDLGKELLEKYLD